MKFDIKFPLVLDVDGTLIRSDLTHDLLIQGLRRSPFSVYRYLMVGAKNKPQLKRMLVDQAGDTVDADHLPYNQDILEIAENHHANGGEVVLCSGSHQDLVTQIANRFSWASQAYGTRNNLNLTGNQKAEFLLDKYPGGFHYVGNSAQDYPVWKVASTGLAINPPNTIDKARVADESVVEVVRIPQNEFTILRKSIRLHQWTKNGIVGLVPLLTVADLTPTNFVNLLLGFFALSLLASSTYILNDLIDAPHDRSHASKKYRPIADGYLSVPQAVLIMGLFSALSIILLLFLPAPFVQVAVIYLVLTISYSWFLKTVPIIDVIVLATLFTVRVIAGATLVEQPMSPWLLSFVATFFLSLALVKRYTEIRKKEGGSALLGRGYMKDDEPLILSLGVMCTGLALLSFLSYSMLAQAPVIREQTILFFILTAVTYWLMRIWLLAHRKVLNDDPVLFAVKDKLSIVLGAAISLLIVVEQLS